jgi:hypothetical protein
MDLPKVRQELTVTREQLNSEGWEIINSFQRDEQALDAVQDLMTIQRGMPRTEGLAVCFKTGIGRDKIRYAELILYLDKKWHQIRCYESK